MMNRRAYVTLNRVGEMSGEELKAEWARRYASQTPNLSPELLRLGIAYRHQEQRVGGLSRSTKAVLRGMAATQKDGVQKSPPRRKLTPGTRLVRDWHGDGHTVTVLENGFECNGKEWRSLSAIAKAITGSHWNGPRFFGLSRNG